MTQQQQQQQPAATVDTRPQRTPAETRAWNEGYSTAIDQVVDVLAQRGWLKRHDRSVRDETTPTVVHFAPYGSAQALDGTPVPRATEWDEHTGDYGRATGFTTRRSFTTCPECRSRFHGDED